MNPGNGDLRIELERQSIWLLPERAAYWEDARTLLIADPHWGKAATFRARGIPVPAGTTGDGVARLVAMLRRCSPRRLVFLGDFLHAREGRSVEMLAALMEWRASSREVEMVLVRGNHDRHAGDPPPELALKCVTAPYPADPFVLTHHPTTSADGYVVAGHIHPAATLRGAGRQSLRFPCFFVGAHTAVLPAFGDFTGLGDIEPGVGDRVYVVTTDGVVSATGSA